MRKFRDPFLDRPAVTVAKSIEADMAEPGPVGEQLRRHAVTQIYRVSYSDGSSQLLMGYELDGKVSKRHGDVHVERWAGKPMSREETERLHLDRGM